MTINYLIDLFIRYIKKKYLIVNRSLLIVLLFPLIFIVSCSSTSTQAGSSTTMGGIQNVTECTPKGVSNLIIDKPAVYGYLVHGLTTLQVNQQFWVPYFPKIGQIAGCVLGSEEKLNGVEIEIMSLPDTLDATAYKIAVSALYNAMKSSKVFYKVVLAKNFHP